MNVGAIIGATVTLVALYLFLVNSDGADRVIRGLASSYGEVVRSLQGR
jgi:flagellar biosynthesis protein FliR